MNIIFGELILCSVKLLKPPQLVLVMDTTPPLWTTQLVLVMDTTICPGNLVVCSPENIGVHDFRVSVAL